MSSPIQTTSDIDRAGASPATAWLDASPAAAFLLVPWPDQTRWVVSYANPAARQLPVALGLTLCRQSQLMTATTAQFAVPEFAVQCHGVRGVGGDHWLIWCAPQAPEVRDATLELEDLREQLAAARAVGRLGLWHRRLPDGEGEWDAGVFAIYGLDPAAGTPHFDVVTACIHPDDQAGLRAVWDASLASGDRGEGRYRVLRPDGEIRFVHSVWRVLRDRAGNAYRVAGIMVDDTASYTLARGLGEMSNRFEIAADLAHIGVWRFDLTSRRVIGDARITRMLGVAMADAGLAEPEILGLVHPDDVQALAEANRRAVSEQVAVDSLTRFITPQGRQCTLLTRRVAQRRADGHVVGLLGVSLDVTEQREAEQRWRFALEGTGDGVWVWDVRTDEVTHSGRCYELIGYECRESTELMEDWLKRLHRDDLPAVRAAAASHVRGETEVFVSEFRMRKASGEWGWYLSRGKAVERDASGRATRIIGTMGDQSARRLADARWRYAIEGSGDAVWEWEAGSNKVFYSDRFQQLLGYDPGEFTDALHEWELRVHPDEFPAVNHAADLHITGVTEHYVAEYRIRCKDGHWKWVLDRGKAVERDDAGIAVRMIGTLIDLSERRAAESALRAAQERIALATQAVGIGIWERDLIEGRSYWDAQMYRLRGLAVDDPRPVDELRVCMVHPDDRAPMAQVTERAIEAGESYAFEFRVLWPDGSTRWLATRGRIEVSDLQMPVRMIGVNWDITEARRASEALRDKDAAERASAAKSEFLARVSHELRTPLNAISGYTTLLMNDPREPVSMAQRERLDRIHGASDHLLAMIEDLLDLTQIETSTLLMQLQPVALQAVLDEVARMLEPQARTRRLDMRWSSAAAVYVMADPVRLRQVLLNLVSNAIKYNRPSGWVEIEITVDARNVVIRVSDGGIGMNAQQIQHLFEPFNRLGAERSSVEGTGIGLTIARRLVHGMGGRLTVSSEVGLGSAFMVCLASAKVDVGRTQDAHCEQTSEARQAHGPVVYIEDNLVNATLVQELLTQRPGIDLVVAGDGLSGVSVVKQMRPRLVLIDMQLPDIDGDEVFRRLQQDPQTRDIPCVALSANAVPEDVRVALDLGFLDYWTKPIDLARFLFKLDELLGA